jgi:lysophospholipase L1-like esterase
LDLVEFWLYKNPEDARKRPPVLLFQGDSITDVGRDRNFLYDLGNGYPHKIQERFPGCIVINKGISGHRTVELLERWDVDTIQMKPDFLSILIGINEVWHKYLHNHPMTLDVFETTYRTLLTAVKTKLPDTKILLIEPFVFSFGHYDPIWQPDVDAEKKIVRQLASEFADYFLPMDDILHQKAKTIPDNAILIDGVHPTDLGHEIISFAIMDVIHDFVASFTGVSKKE